MALEGTLDEVSLPTLVQLMLQEGGCARIQLRHGDQVGSLYLVDGRLRHAALTDPERPDHELNSGKEAIYELLSWKKGAFAVERDIAPPAKTIAESWDYLLIETTRRLDESRAGEEETGPEREDLSEMLLDLSESDAAALRKLAAQMEDMDPMASKSQQLQEILDDLVNNSTDIKNAAVVSSDGLLMASALDANADGSRVAAVTAGLVSLSARSVQQLEQGEMYQTLIQASEGHIVAIRANEQASFVALTPTQVNLGMVFLECRDAASAIRAAL